MPTNSQQEDEPTILTKLRHTVKKRPLTMPALAVTVSFAIGIATGWPLGSSITCGPQCNFDAATVGAIGTWVGGLGTIFALIFTAWKLTNSKRQQEKSDELRADQVAAKAWKVSCRPSGQIVTQSSAMKPKGSTEIYLSVHNLSDRPITKVQISSEWSEEEVLETPQINERDYQSDPASHEFKFCIKNPPASELELLKEISSNEQRYEELDKQYKKVKKEHLSKLGFTASREENLSRTQEAHFLEGTLIQIDRGLSLLDEEIIQQKGELAKSLNGATQVEFTIEGHRFRLQEGKEGERRMESVEAATT